MKVLPHASRTFSCLIISRLECDLKAGQHRASWVSEHSKRYKCFTGHRDLTLHHDESHQRATDKMGDVVTARCNLQVVFHAYFPSLLSMSDKVLLIGI